ncbi:MAG: hypothetical protein E7562_01905 [Ruminococcaceae bacterium]|nr:hypothetical protein [Oscillospiraceae bacterium]
MKIKRCLIALITVIAIVCTLCPLGVFAEDQVYPVKLNVEWHAVEGIAQTTQGKDVFTIATSVNSQEIKFYISLPKEGGFRIYTDNDGVFQPEALNEIVYGKDALGNVTLTAPDGTVVTVKKEATTWQLVVANGKKQVLCLDNSDILFGFYLGEIEHVKVIAPLGSKDEIYGFGQRFNAVNQVGYKIPLWNLDNVYHSKSTALDDKVYSYINAPILHSTAGYTVFMNSAYCVDADLGATEKDKFSLESYGPKFDLYYWTASPVTNVQSYTALTGRSFLPPKWAFSYWAGATNHVWKGTDNGKGQYISILQDFLGGYKKLGIPNLEAIYTESVVMFDPVAYNILKKNNTRMLMWTSGYFNFPTVLSTLGVVDSDAPVVWQSINDWTYHVVNSDTAFLDHSNPLATEYMKKYLQQYVEWGCRGMMVDMGEKIPEDAIYSNGMSGKEMHNFSSYYYLKSVNDAMTELLDGQKDFILFQRSGCAGSQTFGANFLGDNNGKMSGLKQQLNAGLSLSASGFGIWGGDIGGFNKTDSADTYMRWVEFSVFEPLMREHGVGTSNPWEFGGQVENVFVKNYWLRENIIDTIHSSAVNCNLYGTPLAQTLAMAFPGEDAVTKVWDEYMFCDNLLVCPVTENNVTSRDVTLPGGIWYNLWDGKRIEGNQTLNASAPQDRIPVYLKSGAVMPVDVADTFQLQDSMAEGSFSGLVVTPPEKTTTFEAWDDEAKNSIVYKNSLKNSTTFTVTASKETDLACVLAYGVSADAVCVDGLYLPEIDVLDGSIGFYKDNSGKTVIVLPQGTWKTIDIEGIKATAKLNNVAKKAKFTDAKNDKENKILASLKNEDSEYEWVASGAANSAYLMLELENDYTIDSMTLKWGSGYAKEYVVDVSDNGEDWYTVYEAVGSTGGIENISFEAADAKYVRIGNLKRGGNVAPALYNVSVYEQADEGFSFSLKGTHFYYELSKIASVITGGSVELLLAVVGMLFVALIIFVIIVIKKIKRRKSAKV